jgi:hypothetical protein
MLPVFPSARLQLLRCCIVHQLHFQLLSLICSPSSTACSGCSLAAVWDFSATGLFALKDDGSMGGDAFRILKSAFDASYGGNRAPLPIYVHSYWFSNSTVTDMQRFTGERVG